MCVCVYNIFIYIKNTHLVQSNVVLVARDTEETNEPYGKTKSDHIKIKNKRSKFFIVIVFRSEDYFSCVWKGGSRIPECCAVFAETEVDDDLDAPTESHVLLWH